MLKNTFVLSFVLALLALAGCSASSEPPLGGTFAGITMTPLQPPLPEGTLEIDATLGLDAASGHFDLDLNVGSMGLSDTIRLEGDYVAASGMLTFTSLHFDGATDPGRITTEGTSTCVALEGFLETVVCFPTTHDSAYTAAGGDLDFTLEYTVAGTAYTTVLPLTRQP